MAFHLMLDAETDIEVVGEAADGTSAVSMCSALRPDVVRDLILERHVGCTGAMQVVQVDVVEAEAAGVEVGALAEVLTVAGRAEVCVVRAAPG